MTATTVSVNALFKDHYPAPGDRIKQYVVDGRREDAWAAETCPRVLVAPHQTTDLDGNEIDHISGQLQWHELDNGCDVCIAVQVATKELERVQQWLVAKAARPPICADRSQLSDEIAPPLGELRDHPMLAMLRRPR